MALGDGDCHGPVVLAMTMGREVAAFGDGDCHTDLRAVEDAGPYTRNDR